MILKKAKGLILILICVGLILPPMAMAHKVIFFAWVENNQIMVEAGFGSKRPAVDCDILAHDHQGNLVYQGKTNKNGRHSFKVPKGFDTDMILELKAGPGHRGEWTIKADEFNSQKPKDTNRADSSRNSLENGPDPLKIIAGIALIFALAFGLKKLKKGNPQ
ncbi:MAG: hypothetical protein HUK40_21095 [Desulfobacter sp.]|nr:hypothetical protein [Desulfobacter sp.]